MILRHTSREFRTLFILEFTKELIRNSIPKDLLLEKAMESPEKELGVRPVDIKEKVMERVFEESKKDLEGYTQSQPILVREEVRPAWRPRVMAPPIQPPLIIPAPRFPPRLQYIQPVPREEELDLGQLNLLVKDPLVSVIECNGADTNIIVRGRMGAKPTNISLPKEEIDKIVDDVSKKSKIPVQEGIFRAAVGKIMFSAIISEITGTKFLITRINPVQQGIQRPTMGQPVRMF